MEEEIKNIEHLLKEVNAISEKYSKVAKALGEDFNIFQTLCLRSKEFIYSKFIAELLNPKGSHEMGDVFLKFFFECIKIKNFSTDGAKIIIEKYVPYSKTYKSSGKIDIFLENKNKQRIIIENKIDAKDLKDQLAKYNEAYSEATIIYLTLDGREPSPESTNNGKVETNNISYRDHILSWLEQCKEKTTSFPLLRETIAQYINVLKYLTGQTRRKDMSEDIVNKILESRENIESAFEIEANINETKKKVVLDKFVYAIIKSAKKHELTPEYDENEDCSKQYWGLSLKKDSLGNDIRIRFEFGGRNFKNLVYGLYVKNNENIPDNENVLIKLIKTNNNFKTVGPWIAQGEFFEDLGDKKLGKDELLYFFYQKSELIEKCEEKIEELLDLLRDENKSTENCAIE